MAKRGEGRFSEQYVFSIMDSLVSTTQELKLKILVFTSVFPNEKQPALGIFIRERMFHVGKFCDIKVIAPIPWFPLSRYLRKSYRPLAAKKEIQKGIEVYHPKFFNVPGLFKFLDGLLIFLSSVWTAYKIKKSYEFDIIDAHFAYPDGLGAILLGLFFKKPVTITVRGTINLLHRYPLRRCQIAFALKRAKRVFSVCEDLKKKAIRLGIPRDKILVVPNGVDLSQFKPMPQSLSRQELNLPRDRKIIISIGWLVKRKGFQRIIHVLPSILREQPNVSLIIIGGTPPEGSYRPELEKLIETLHLNEYVLFAGPVPHNEIQKWLNAADVFCLATDSEGWANVFLEALACGKPVVTTSVGGNGEVIKSSDFGLLVEADDQAGLEKALLKSFETNWDGRKLIDYATQNSWDKAASILIRNFEEILNDPITNY